jgi:hypothetical protein
VESQREWWRRALAVVVRPRAVFAALRGVEEAELEARQEPILAIILLAGIGGILITPAWDTIMDNYERDALVTAVLTFIGGGLYGAALYWIAGTALALVLRGLGGVAPVARARHVLAFACVPLVLLIGLALLEAGLYGADAFRTGGDDEGTHAAVFTILQALVVAWSVGLLVLGVHVVERFSWPRVAASIALVGLFLAAFSVVANGVL